MKIWPPYWVHYHTRGETQYRALMHNNEVLGDFASRKQLETAYFAHKRFIKEKEKVKA